MNVFVYELATGDVDPEPDITPEKFVVEDNIGEGIHVHHRNVRVELSIDDYETFVDELTAARERLNDGNR